MMWRQEMVPNADLNIIGALKPVVDCRGMTRAYVQVVPRQGDVPGTAVVSARKTLLPETDQFAVAFGSPPSLTLTGASIVEIDVTETPFLLFTVTTAEGALCIVDFLVYLTDEGA